MALSISLPGYKMESQAAKDNYLTHYNAFDEHGARCIVTEFNPSYMVSRNDDGTLEAGSRFVSEYSTSLDKFIVMAEAMKALSDPAVTPVVDVVEGNGTAYIVREYNELPPLSTFISGKRMSTGEAFLFIRPLLMYLSQAFTSNFFFTFTENDLRVNRYGQLVLDSMFTWDTNYQTTIADVTKVYYLLITGARYDPASPSAATYGVTLPPRLETMMTAIFNGDNLYGSIDDFFKTFKSEVDTHTAGRAKEGGGSRDLAGLLKWVGVGLASVLFIAAMVFLNLYLLPMYRNIYPGFANPNLLKKQAVLRRPIDRVYDFFALAYTSPANGNDIIEGSFALRDGVLYYREYESGYSLTAQGAAKTVLARDVRPSFITVTDTHVYFCDGLKGNQIFRVPLGGGEPEPVSRNCALYLWLDGDYLYYTNHDDADSLYRVDLATLEDAPARMTAAYDSVMHDGTLYYSDPGQGGAVFSVQPSAQTREAARLNTADSSNLRWHDGLLYYLERGFIKAMTPDGAEMPIDAPLKVYNFHPADNRLLIIEADTYHLYDYDLRARTLTALAPGTPYAYVWARDGAAYAREYDDSRVFRAFELTQR